MLFTTLLVLQWQHCQQSDVHWVALIIDFMQSQILYGDSTGQPIDKKITNILTGGPLTMQVLTSLSLALILPFSMTAIHVECMHGMHCDTSSVTTPRFHHTCASVDCLQMFLQLVRHYKFVSHNGQS